MRVLLVATLGLSVTGCMGVYVEAHGTLYPSMRYEADDSAGPKPVLEGKTTYAAGLAVGLELDAHRKNRFAFGFDAQGTPLPGGGKVDGAQGEIRADIGVAAPTPTSRVRVGMGFGLGSARVHMKTADGTALDEKHGNGHVFAGPVFSQYFGKRHEVSAMLSGSTFGAGAPGGALRSLGVGAAITYSFHFDDTRPGTTTYTPLDNGKNVLDLVDAGARRLGCESRYVERRGDSGLTATAVFAACPPDMDEIRFVQTVDGIMVECPHLDDAQCRVLTNRVVEAAKSILEKK